MKTSERWMSLKCNALQSEWRDRKKMMLLPEIHNLCDNHWLAVLVRNRVQGAEKHLLYWRSPTRVLLALLGADMHLHHGSPPVPPGSHPHTAPPAARGAMFTSVSVVHSLGAQLTRAAVLPVHYEHSWGFVCGEEKSYLSKPWRKSPPCPVSQCQERFWVKSLVVVCERCHVRRCKWLMGNTICQTGTQSDLLYLTAFSVLFIDCCSPEHVEVHWWIICMIVTLYQVRTSTLTHCNYSLNLPPCNL